MIVLSACRYRVIRTFRAKGFLDNRVIGLPITYYSCLSCFRIVVINRALDYRFILALAKSPRMHGRSKCFCVRCGKKVKPINTKIKPPAANG